MLDFLREKKSGDGTKCNKKGHSSLSLSLSWRFKTTCKIPKSPMIVNLGYLACKNHLWCGGGR